MNILMTILIAFETLVGVVSTLYVVISLFWTLGQKFYRKCRYNISLFN